MLFAEASRPKGLKTIFKTLQLVPIKGLIEGALTYRTIQFSKSYRCLTTEKLARVLHPSPFRGQKILRADFLSSASQTLKCGNSLSLVPLAVKGFFYFLFRLQPPTNNYRKNLLTSQRFFLKIFVVSDRFSKEPTLSEGILPMQCCKDFFYLFAFSS